MKVSYSAYDAANIPIANRALWVLSGGKESRVGFTAGSPWWCSVEASVCCGFPLSFGMALRDVSSWTLASIHSAMRRWLVGLGFGENWP